MISSGKWRAVMLVAPRYPLLEVQRGVTHAAGWRTAAASAADPGVAFEAAIDLLFRRAAVSLGARRINGNPRRAVHEDGQP
jgi:hypothetical protein